MHKITRADIHVLCAWVTTYTTLPALECIAQHLTRFTYSIPEHTFHAQTLDILLGKITM